MNKKIYSLLIITGLITNHIFADSYGFAFNHSGFWNWAGGIILFILAIALDLVIWAVTSDEFLNIIPEGKQFLYLFPALFSIIGFWFFPSYFCSFLGLVIGFGVTCFYLKHRNKFFILNGVIFTLSLIFSFILISRLLPQEWWIWKYFCITFLFIILAQSISFTFYASRTFAILFLSIFFIAITVMTINECSIHANFLSKILYIIMPIVTFIIIIAGIRSYKQYTQKKEKQYKTLFGKTTKETKLLINKVSKINKYDLKDMANYLDKALTAFDEHNETAAVDNLESFFRKNTRYNEKNVKGPENKKNYKDFCQIANKLAKKLEYKYEPPKYDKPIYSSSIENEDDYDSDNEEEITFSTNESKNKNIEQLLEELNSLTGLSRVKEEINKIIGVMKINEQREKVGLKGSSISLHLVFSGNPGTGKTTVARLLAAIYKELGILSIGKCIETDSAGLVAGYVGQTALKTKKVIKEALGGILFIDEAYTLAVESNDFGQEAIDTLLKYMEDKRDDFMVIAAGYPNKMEKFIKSNPGLESRFTTVIHFDDYNAKELYDIFMKMATSEDKQFIVSEENKGLLKAYFNQMYNNRKSNFANAREVRNYLEQCEKRLAARLAKQNVEKLTKKDLTTLITEDLGL